MANAAELTREYKELLDAGIITQAEFDKKKEKFLTQESLEPHLWIECVIKGHELLSDGVITEADFETIKANAFSDKGHGYKTDIGDITQLKALLDDGCIGEKDFEDLKSRVLKGDKIYTLGYVDTLGFLRDSHSKGIFGDASYEALKKKFLNARTDPYPNLRSNTENLVSMHKLLDEGYISAEDYAVFEKSAAGGSVVRSGATVSPIRTFKALSDKGLITEDELGMIRKNLLFAKKINGNFAWPGFFEKVAELNGKGILSDDELASLKSAYIHGSKIPDEEAFARIERYDGLAKEGLFEEDEFDILKDRAFSGVEVLTDEKLEGIREYKKLLDEGTISNDDFRQYKSNQLVLDTGKKYVIMDADAIKKDKKRKRKKATKWIIILVLLAALAGVIAYIPKFMTHRTIDSFLSEVDGMLADRQYEEVRDRVDELRDQKPSEEDEERLTLAYRYSAFLEHMDYGYGSSGNSPHDVFNEINDGLEEYGVMPFLLDAFSEYKGFESITSADVEGRIQGTQTVRENNNSKKKDDSKSTVSTVATPVPKGFLTFGFTKKDENGSLEESNIIPAAKLEVYDVSTLYGKKWFEGVIPLDQMDNFTVQQKDGNLNGTGSFKNGAIYLTIGYVDIVLNQPLEVKSSSKSKSSSGSSSSSGSGNWQKNPTGNGVINDDGYIIYDNNGVTEITDGKGNWAQDTDGDGNLDTFGSDPWY